jgi:hypothetical protein
VAASASNRRWRLKGEDLSAGAVSPVWARKPSMRAARSSKLFFMRPMGGEREGPISDLWWQASCGGLRSSHRPGRVPALEGPRPHVRASTREQNPSSVQHGTSTPIGQIGTSIHGASLLVALDAHPRVAMQTLWHSQIAMTMEIYSEIPTAKTRSTQAGWAESSMARVAVLRCCTEIRTGRSGERNRPSTRVELRVCPASRH